MKDKEDRTDSPEESCKKMKGKREHGRDEIDSYSLKLTAPLMKESLLHVVNLSIESQNFAKPWKPQLIQPFHKKEREYQGGELQASVPSGRGGKDGGVCSRRTDT